MCRYFGLGPKMYVATRDAQNKGSTKLHLDVTSAINLLVHVQHSQRNLPDDGAIWSIFMAKDSDGIRSYLRDIAAATTGTDTTSNTAASTQPLDPIHAQTTFLDDKMLRELSVRGIRPFTFMQHVGEAVFIPAGCAHQVCNEAHTIVTPWTDKRLALGEQPDRLHQDRL